MTQPPINSGSIGVVGAGRLGSSLSLALLHAGYVVTAVTSSSRSTARALVERLPGARDVDIETLVATSELVLLTVPDDALRELANRLLWRRGQQVVHCSGAHSLDVIQAAANAGAMCGCLHPLQSFPERFCDPLRFTGISCGVEAQGPLLDRLVRMCADLGASVIQLAGINRAAYHAAAVFASGYVIALHAAAAQAWTLAGLPPEDAQRALAPLTLSAAQNVQRLSLEAALTGPVARADIETVARHIDALAPVPELLALYRGLGMKLLALPLALTVDQRAALQALLEGK
jgi:predicted short-subunit dehydrogenase-like oxidoreductase (DUF2520 family)